MGESARDAWVFPGQGSQFSGMAAELSLTSAGEDLVDEAEHVSGVPLRDLTSRAGAAALADPHVAQLAVFVHGVAFAEELRRGGRSPVAVAGHSLGEYTALVVSETLSWSYALRVVDARGRAMARAARSTPGTMGAIVGPPGEEVAAWCTAEGAVLANFNSPRQHVVSGHAEAVDGVLGRARDAGAIRARRLPVGGAYHSPLMAPAQEDLARLVERAPLRPPRIALISSVDGEVVGDVEAYREKLRTQVCRPVQWQATVRSLAAFHPTTMVEVGPGRVLSGLGREMLPDTNHAQAPRLLTSMSATGIGGGRTS